MQIPTVIIEYLTKVYNDEMLGGFEKHGYRLKYASQFWKAEDEKIAYLILTRDIPLALGFIKDDENSLSKLPTAYKYLYEIDNFNSAFSFYGWQTVSGWVGEGMTNVIAAFRYFGLNKEADGYLAAENKAKELLAIGQEPNISYLIEAYESVVDTPSLPYDGLLKFVCDNPQEFCVMP